MSLIRMQLWRKCILLHSKAVDASLQQYSTRVQLCPVVWNSIKAPMVSSMLQGRRTSTQIWHRWTLGGHGQSHAKTLTTEVKDSGANVDFPGHSHAKTLTAEVKDNGADVGCSLVDAVSFRNPHSQQLTDAMSKVDRQQVTDLNLDDVPPPHLSPLEEISDVEAVSLSLNIPSAMPPASSTLRDYVDDSETLSKLVQLGVDLWKLEQRPNVGTMLLKLDFVTDVVPRLVFLKQIGVEDSRLGHLLSHNPFILTESLENLQARVDFLLSKKFSSEAVASMVSRAPYLLNFSVKRLDNRLAFFQENLNLSPQKTRDIVARLPRMLCGRLEPIKENLQVFKREFGFRENDMQHIVTRIPKVLTSNKKKLTQIFDYVHNTMNVPIHLIVKFPQALNSKYLRIRERHLFLQYLGKAQYDPTQPNYIALDRFVVTPDEIFCTELASATLKDFELFQKTL